MRIATILLLGLALALFAQAAAAQSGQQLVIRVSFAAPVKATGGSYYIAFAISDSLLAGPQPDSTNWTHYVIYRDGRFFFGVVPITAARPYGFEAVRPPVPFADGMLLEDRRAVRVTVPLSILRTGASLPTRLMANVVTLDSSGRPADALGPGASDRLGFVTMDLRRDLVVQLRDPKGDCADPSLDILSGEMVVATP